MEYNKTILIQEVEHKLSGNFKQDIKFLANKLRGHYQWLRQDKEVRDALESVLVSRYPDHIDIIYTIWNDLINESDEKFIAKMRRLVEEGNATEAQFEMNFFIRAMEDELIQYKPKPRVKYLSIDDEVDLFEFNVHEDPQIELKMTARNYAAIYVAYAQILNDANEWKEAAEAYQQAMLWNPYNAEIIYDLAELYQRMEQYGMSYATVLNGLKYSVKVSDLARGFLYLGIFYEKNNELETATQFYHRSQYWQNTRAVEKKLLHIQTELGELPPALSEEELKHFEAKNHLQHYPNQGVVNQLKAFGSRMLIAKNYHAAYEYYRLYDEIRKGEDKEALSVVDDLRDEMSFF